MKTNCIKGNLELYERIAHLEKENTDLKEKVNSCLDFIKILEQWFEETEEQPENNCIDLGTY